VGFEGEIYVLQQAEPWIRVAIDVSAFIGGAALLFWKLDKRVSLMEQKIESEFDRIHNNGFASKVELARLIERVDAVQRFCAIRHQEEERPHPDAW